MRFHPGLEGLRGVAVLAVLVFHAEESWLPGGFLGVSTFFTLSGFLITGLLLAESEATGRVAFKRFWGRRLRRLLPASLFALFGIAVTAPLWADYEQLERLRGDGLAALAYVANWWMIATGADYASAMGSPSPIQHFWSLAIEEQYYAVFPVLCALLLSQGGRRLLGAALAVGCLASWWWMVHLEEAAAPTARIYFGTDTRCAELLCGGLLAVALGRGSPQASAGRWWTAAGVVGFAVSAWHWRTATVDTVELYRFGLQSYAIASMAIVGAALVAGGAVARVLSLGPLRWLGRVSYGVYVYHWPIFLALDEEVTGVGGLELAAVRFAATFLVAELSYRWLEEPIRSGRRVTGASRGLVPLGGIAIVALALFASTRSVSSFERRSAGIALSEPMRIAVVGDSVGGRIAQGLSAWAEDIRGLSILDLTARGCGVARGSWTEAMVRKSKACDMWPRRVGTALDREPVDLVVLSSGGWDMVEREREEWGGGLNVGDELFDEWLAAQYAEALEFFQERQLRVVWLTIPCFGRFNGVLKTYLSRHVNRTIVEPLAAEHQETMALVDLRSAVCPNDEFTNRLDGIEPFRPDGIHFSYDGSLWVAEWLGPQLIELGLAEQWPLRRLPQRRGHRPPA